METLYHSIIDFLGISPTLAQQLSLTLLVVAVYLGSRGLIEMLIRRKVPGLTRQYIVGKTLVYLMGFVALVLLFRIWLDGVSGLFTYLGIISAGFAIALKDIIANFVGWLYIAIRKPFGVGDRIQIGPHSGDVIDLSLFQFTMIEICNWVDADQSTGRVIHVPNGWVFSHAQTNFTQGFNFIWNELPVRISFESNWRKAKQLLLDIGYANSSMSADQAECEIRKATKKFLIFFKHLTPSVWTSVVENGVTLTLRYVCEPRKRRYSSSKMWEGILAAFAEHDDIQFAYPTTRFFNNKVEGKEGAQLAGLYGVEKEAPSQSDLVIEKACHPPMD